MAKRAEKGDEVEKLLKDLIKAVEQNTIVMLGLRGIPQQKIRAMLGGDLNRITKCGDISRGIRHNEARM